MNRSVIASIFCVLLVHTGIGVTGQTTYTYPFQDPGLPVEERAYDLVSRLTLKEKVTQFFNYSEGIPRLGIPEYDWWNECLHGVARAGKATVFPQAIGLAATFDESLILDVATAISDEARAKHHYFIRNDVRSIYTGLTFWSPNINIFRDPRWGRGQETYGEDPYLTGRIAVNFIKGLQGNDPKYLKTIATAKHYAVHSGPEYSRHIDNIFVNDRDLYETYLPAFRASVKEAKVQSVMCAYNRFRDQPCCGSDLLLGNILRNEFGFEGYIVSDCGAISDFYTKNAHHVVETPAQAWGWSVASGTDLNCETPRSFLVENLDSAINNGILNEKDLDRSLIRLYIARFRLGMFDPEIMVPYAKIPMSVVGSKEHRQLALKTAEKSMVLLKNNGILPLKRQGRIALIGPNADNFDILIANYNGEPVVPVTPLDGLISRLGARNVVWSPGCPLVPGIYTNYEPVDFSSLYHSEGGKILKGLKAEYFEESDFKGNPKTVKVDSMINFYWLRSPLNNKVEDSFSVKWTGILIPKKSGTYKFGGNTNAKINGQETGNKEFNLEKGKQYALEASVTVNPFWWRNAVEQSAKLTWVEVSKDYKKEALDAARRADVIVFCGGIDANLEGEEMPLEIDGFSHGDRTHINLPAVQEDLLKELDKTNKPIIYVNFSGSAIALNWENENADAVIQAFYPGEATGIALARMIYGDFNPSGRLPVTFYKSTDDLPDFKDYRMAGRTYRYFSGESLWPFGYGLSYTQFSYNNLVVPESAAAGSDIKISVEVTNSGKMEGEEVVQVYIRDDEASVPVPLKSLAGFRLVLLKPGETRMVEITLSRESFSIIDKNYTRAIEPGMFTIFVGGSQPIADGKNALNASINISGPTFVIK